MSEFKKYLVLAGALILCLALLTAAQDVRRADSRDFAVGPSGTLTFSNITGELEVTGWDQDLVHVEYELTADGRYATELVDALEFKMEQRGDDVVVEVEWPDDDERRDLGLPRHLDVDLNIDFKIQVPRGFRLDVNLVTGDFDMTGVRGGSRINLVTGDLSMSQVAGRLDVNLVTGDLEARNCEGNWDVNNVTGGIVIDGFSGEIESNVVTGSARINAHRLDDAGFNAITGSIELTIDEPITSGDFDFSVMTGSVTLRIDGASSFEVDAEAKMGGDIENDFGLLVEEASRYTNRLKMRGIVGGGGADISITTMNGDIKLLQK